MNFNSGRFFFKKTFSEYCHKLLLSIEAKRNIFKLSRKQDSTPTLENPQLWVTTLPHSSALIRPCI